MIEVSSLSKKYGNHLAVDDVSFTINKGEIVGFLGPNGAGKSTIMNIMTGYLSMSAGSVSIDGFDIVEQPEFAKKRVGYLPELPPLYTDMTVREYLYFMYDLKKVKFPKKPHIEEIARLVKIENVIDRLIKNLSKGYRQRVGIAQALIGNPDLLILDEPTVGLDPKQIIEIRDLITSLGKEHTVILSTHILPEVNAVCDRVVIIDKGRIVANEKTSELEAVSGMRKMIVKVCGPVQEVLGCLGATQGVKSIEIMPGHDAGSTSYLVESETNVDVRKPIFNTLASKGYPMIGLEGFSASLEDVFIAIIDKNKKEENK